MVITTNAFSTNLGTLPKKNLTENINNLKKTQIFLFIPVTIEDALNEEVMPNIIDKISNFHNEYKCLDNVIFGLDQADKKGLEKVKKKIEPIHHAKVIWNNSNEITDMYKELKINGIGKGRNMWTALGYLYAEHRDSIFVTHDGDIKDYSTDIILNLAAPLANPKLDFDFTKAYYERLTKKNGKMSISGRVKRLLVEPLLESMKVTYNQNSEVVKYIDYIQSFIYPLSGEFAMRSNVANILNLQPDWGLEIGTLNFLYKKKFEIAQVDLGIYDHKHSEVNHDDPTKGLNRMSEEISKTIFRKLHDISLDVIHKECFDNLLIEYEKLGRNAIKNSKNLSSYQDWYYDEIKELETLNTFIKSVKNGFNKFSKKTYGVKPLTSWNDIEHKHLETIIYAVDKYN